MIVKKKSVSSPSCLLSLWCLVFIILAGQPQPSIGQTEEPPPFRANQELLNWEAPLFMQKLFPYTLSGYDRDGTPVWLFEIGKWDIRSFLETYGQHEGHKANLTRYIEQMYERVASPEEFSRPNDPQEDFLIIMDMDGFSTAQLAHLPTIQQWLMGTRILFSIASVQRKNYHIKRAYIVNSNFVFQTLWNILRSVLGRFSSTVEIYGTNTETWRPVLLREISKDQLPPSLGGPQNFAPVKLFG